MGVPERLSAAVCHAPALLERCVRREEKPARDPSSSSTANTAAAASATLCTGMSDAAMPQSATPERPVQCSRTFTLAEHQVLTWWSVKHYRICCEVQIQSIAESTMQMVPKISSPQLRSKGLITTGWQLHVAEGSHFTSNQANTRWVQNARDSWLCLATHANPHVRLVSHHYLVCSNSVPRASLHTAGSHGACSHDRAAKTGERPFLGVIEGSTTATASNNDAT
jgi:hypothetical protein